LGRLKALCRLKALKAPLRKARLDRRGTYLAPADHASPASLRFPPACHQVRSGTLAI